MPLALVTGASSGIGAATASALVAEGYRVALVARSMDRLLEVADPLGEAATVHALDASDGDAVLNLVGALGAVDVLVNSAGAGAWKRIEETSPQEAVVMMNAPYQAAFNATHAVMPGMLQRGKGVIVHVGSPASMCPWPSSVGYAASRFALRGLHEALCMDLHGSGVASCHVVFGRVESPYFERNAHAAERIPGIGNIVRTIQPEEAARIVVRTVLHPRKNVYHPLSLRLNYALFAVAPWLTRYLLRSTGYSQ
ncbi:MAG: SDR family NAD(P)-dependent oxidoreductase [Rhodothermales bacterium]|nr:SDR family NAD(P)-dependent oxidoreductase [Rhodothermales bacterium]MBO6781182.1 SDR family NAD(P)-dependent oxidoreductase [Rhodothermales bacterium]